MGKWAIRRISTHLCLFDFSSKTTFGKKFKEVMRGTVAWKVHVCTVYRGYSSDTRTFLLQVFSYFSLYTFSLFSCPIH